MSGGTLTLDFNAAGAPTSNIINSNSALTFNGQFGALVVNGSGAGAVAQTFNGTTIAANPSHVIEANTQLVCEPKTSPSPIHVTDEMMAPE